MNLHEPEPKRDLPARALSAVMTAVLRRLSEHVDAERIANPKPRTGVGHDRP